MNQNVNQNPNQRTYRKVKNLVENAAKNVVSARKLAEKPYTIDDYGDTIYIHEQVMLTMDEHQIICRDIGRHNALDKAIGSAVRGGLPLPRAVMCTS